MERQGAAGARSARRPGLEGHAAVASSLQDKARTQLGTCGSGNHFVEWGVFTLKEDPRELGLEAGQLPGAAFAQRLARRRASDRQRVLASWRWTCTRSCRRSCGIWRGWPLDSEAGQEYWAAMEPDGRLRCGEPRRASTSASPKPRALRSSRHVENHHNFAWKEMHGGSEADRPPQRRDAGRQRRARRHPRLDGRPPASSCAARAVTESINSASHGAGRRWAAPPAINTVTHIERDIPEGARRDLARRRHRRIPVCVQGHRSSMAAQADLVDRDRKFDPKIVKMADAAGDV